MKNRISGIFSSFYGQHSVTAATATKVSPSPWNIFIPLLQSAQIDFCKIIFDVQNNWLTKFSAFFNLKPCNFAEN